MQVHHSVGNGSICKVNAQALTTIPRSLCLQCWLGRAKQLTASRLDMTVACCN